MTDGGDGDSGAAASESTAAAAPRRFFAFDFVVVVRASSSRRNLLHEFDGRRPIPHPLCPALHPLIGSISFELTRVLFPLAHVAEHTIN